MINQIWLLPILYMASFYFQQVQLFNQIIYVGVLLILMFIEILHGPFFF